MWLFGVWMVREGRRCKPRHIIIYAMREFLDISCINAST